jgi:hypothetical protein
MENGWCEDNMRRTVPAPEITRMRIERARFSLASAISEKIVRIYHTLSRIWTATFEAPTMANPNTVARIFKQIQRVGFSGLMRNLSKCVSRALNLVDSFSPRSPILVERAGL